MPESTSLTSQAGQTSNFSDTLGELEQASHERTLAIMQFNNSMAEDTAAAGASKAIKDLAHKV